MLTVNKQALAEQDIIEIWKYSFSNWGEAQADKCHDQLSRSIPLIAENPYIGMACDNVRKGYRKYRVNRHIIFYRVDKNTLQIIRVLGEKMDYSSRL